MMFVLDFLLQLLYLSNYMSIEIEGFTNKELENNIFNKSLYLTKLPTKEWLINKKVIFYEEEIYILLSELFKKNTIIVKLNIKNDNLVEYYIHKKLLNHNIPNIIKYYGVIKCFETNKNIKFKFINGYCDGKQTDNLINLTVMKKYDESEKLVNNKLNLYECIECIYQLTISLLLLYRNYGILHNDLRNAGNMFIVKNTKLLIYDININNILNIKIKPSIKIILFDFDNSEIIDPVFRLKNKKLLYPYDIKIKSCNIITNIIDLIKIILERIDNEKNLHSKVLLLHDRIKNIEFKCNEHIQCINDMMRIGMIDIDKYKKLTEDFIFKILKVLYNFDNEINDKIINITKKYEKYDYFAKLLNE